MLPKTSRERRRHVAKRILVNHVEATRRASKLPLERANVKLQDGRATNESAKSIAGKVLTEYLQNSSVHGIKYLSNLRIRPSIVGKFLWGVIMICSFVFLIWMVNTFWKRYNADPLRTVIESFQAPVFMIPFPAVTMCPLVPPLIERRTQLLDRLRLPNGMDNKTAMFLLKYGAAFSSEHVPGGKNHMNKLRTLLDFNYLTLLEFLKFLRPCEDLLESCWWNGIQKNCSALFRMSHASQGICCSFNFLLEDYIGTDRNTRKINFLRTAYYGPASGLTIVLHPGLLVENDDTGENIRYSTNSIGILVFSHHPMEYIGAISNRHLLQAGHELRVAVIPNVKKKISGYYRRDSNNELVPYCRENDVKLQYLPTYLYSNCFIDCSIEASLRICGCVPYYYEPMAVKFSLKICDWNNFDCLYKNADNIRVIQETTKANFTCKCYSPCQDVYYDTQASIGLLNRHESSIWHIYKNLSRSQAIVKVFLSYETFTVSDTIPIADELYLLASVGGIFSLFLGCSFISAVEISYYIGLYFRSYYKSRKSK